MTVFLAITSLINIAIGYWLARYIDTGRFLPPFGTRSRKTTNFATYGEPSPSDGSGNAIGGVDRGVSGTTQPTLETPPRSSSQHAKAGATTSKSPSAPTPANGLNPPAKNQAAAPQPTVGAAESAPESGKNVDPHDADTGVEEGVLAGIEAFRSQLAEMKEASSVSALNKNKE